MARLLGLVLVALLLAGCNDDSGGGADSDGQASATQPALPRDETLEPAPLPSLEVFNDTLTFASATGGSAGSGTFEVPEGYGNVTVTVTAFADCPGYSKQGGIHITATGLDESLLLPFTALMPGSDAAGYEPSSCSAADLASDRISDATTTATWIAGSGSGNLQATGEFTGEARVVVVAHP